MPEEALRRRRGPKPNPDRGSPSGYRLTDRTRFELQVAATFVGTASLQDTIGLAVHEFLARMQKVDGFSDAIQAAEAHQQRRAGVPTLASLSADDADPGGVSPSF